MKFSNLVLITLLGAAPVASQADVGFGLSVNVNEAPPAPRYERVAVAPGPDVVWIGGHWAWHGRWLWENGRWEHRHHDGTVWMGGHWDHRGAGWVWVDGRWDAPVAPPVAYNTGEIFVESAPPAPYAETYGPAPGPDFFWIGGRWNWQGNRWLWAGGHYERHPNFHPGAAWNNGHWDHRGTGYVWTEGRWR